MESTSKSKPITFLGAVLIAAGTSIGAGMLALPVLTGLAGFWPAVLIYIISWLIVTYASLMLLEVNLTLGYEANLLSMAKTTLGPVGRAFAFTTYIFLFYSVSVAYLALSGTLINSLLMVIFKMPFSNWVGVTLSLLLYLPALYSGTRALANTNIVLVLGIVVSYVLLISLGARFINTEYLLTSNWKYSLMGIPVIATSFTFQNVIPSLTTYLKRDLKALKWVIILGGFIPLIIYIIWEWFVLGIIPIEGSISIKHLLRNGQSASQGLVAILKNGSVNSFSQIFAFCAIATSYLGVILSLFDFLADGFKIEKTGSGKTILCSLIFIPPYVIAILFPKIFLLAISYAGSFGCATLFVILPALMLWKSRYKLHIERKYQVVGGKISLAAMMIIGVAVIILQFLLTFKVIPC